MDKTKLFRELRKYVCGNEAIAYIVKEPKEKVQESMLKHLDRLLAGETWCGEGLNAVKLLWKEEGGEIWSRKEFDFEEELSKGQMALLQYYRDLTQMLMSLWTDKSFQAMRYFNITSNEDRTLGNRRLIHFVRNTPYRNVALRVVQYYRRRVLNSIRDVGYLPAYDYLGELPYYAAKSKDMANGILDGILDVERHIDKGVKMGLSMDEIITHDEIYGFFMNRFEESVIPYAKRISAFINEEMPKHLEGYDKSKDIDDQSEEVTNRLKEGLEKVAGFIRYLRDREFGEGWLADYDISFGYLMEHSRRVAEECGRKE